MDGIAVGDPFATSLLSSAPFAQGMFRKAYAASSVVNHLRLDTLEAVRTSDVHHRLASSSG